MSDLDATIIIDSGSFSTRAGFAEKTSPSVCFPTVVGYSEGPQVLRGPDAGRNYYVGRFEEQNRYPIQKGEVADFDMMEKVWYHIFKNKLSVEPEYHPVILTESLMNRRETRQKTMRVMFEAWRVPQYYVAPACVLSLYSQGLTTGIALESGDSATNIVPVYEGHSYLPAMERLQIGGREITSYLQRLLNERDWANSSKLQKQKFLEIKEQYGFVALDFDQEMAKPDSEIDKVHSGMLVSKERFQAPELLFKPKLNGLSMDGLVEHLQSSIAKCHPDLKSELCANIVLSGGTTMFDGFPERIEKEVTRIAPGMEFRVVAPAKQDRLYAAWMGGAKLASEPIFEKMALTLEEYMEVGENCLRRFIQ